MDKQTNPSIISCVPCYLYIQWFSTCFPHVSNGSYEPSLFPHVFPWILSNFSNQGWLLSPPGPQRLGSTSLSNGAALLRYLGVVLGWHPGIHPGDLRRSGRVVNGGLSMDYLWIIYGLSMELSMIINGYLWILSTMQWWMEGAIDKRSVWGILIFLMNRALPGASTARFHVTISQSQIVQKFFDRPHECFQRYVNHVISSPEVPFLGCSILGG